MIVPVGTLFDASSRSKSGDKSYDDDNDVLNKIPISEKRNTGASVNPVVSNEFLGDQGKVNACIYSPSAIAALTGNFTIHDSLSMEMSVEREKLETAMKPLADAIEKDDQLRAISELALILEDEEKNRLLGLALNGDYRKLIKDCKWPILRAILECNARGPFVRSEANHNGGSSGGQLKIKGNGICQTKAKSYPSFASNKEAITVEEKFLNTICEYLKSKKVDKKLTKDILQVYQLFTDGTEIAKKLSIFEEKHRKFEYHKESENQKVELEKRNRLKSHKEVAQGIMTSANAQQKSDDSNAVGSYLILKGPDQLAEEKHKELTVAEELTNDNARGLELKCKPSALSRFHEKTEKLFAKFLNGQEEELKTKKSKSIFVTFKSTSTTSTDAKQKHCSNNPATGYWALGDPERFAEELTSRDCGLIGAIEFDDVRKWVLGEAGQPKSVADLEKIYDATVQSMAIEIVLESNDEERRKLIDKYLELGAILLNNHNLHSASLVACALSHPAVDCLLSSDIRQNPSFCELSELLDSDEMFAKLHNIKSGCTLFPIDSTFWKKLRNPDNKWIVDEKFVRQDDLKEFTKFGVALKNFRTIDLPSLGKESQLDLLVFLQKPVPANVIKELSWFIYDIKCNYPFSKPEFADANSAGLAHCFIVNLVRRQLAEYNDLTILKSLLSEGIHTGMQLLEKFSEDKTFISNWPYHMRITMYAEYTMHLSKKSSSNSNEQDIKSFYI